MILKIIPIPKVTAFTVSGVDIRAVGKFFPLLSFSDQNIHFDTIAFFPRIEKYLVYFGVYALKMFYLAMAENIPVTPRF